MYFHRYFFRRKIVTFVYNFLTVLVHTHINMKHIRICVNKVWVHTLIRKISIFAYFCVKVELLKKKSLVVFMWIPKIKTVALARALY